jgi:hypothetical protein
VASFETAFDKFSAYRAKSAQNQLDDPLQSREDCKHTIAVLTEACRECIAPYISRARTYKAANTRYQAASERLGRLQMSTEQHVAEHHERYRRMHDDLYDTSSSTHVGPRDLRLPDDYASLFFKSLLRVCHEIRQSLAVTIKVIGLIDLQMFAACIL